MLNININGEFYRDNDSIVEQKRLAKIKKIKTVTVVIVLVVGFLLCARLDNILLVNGIH